MVGSVHRFVNLFATVAWIGMMITGVSVSAYAYYLGEQQHCGFFEGLPVPEDPEVATALYYAVQDFCLETKGVFVGFSIGLIPGFVLFYILKFWYNRLTKQNPAS